MCYLIKRRPNSFFKSKSKIQSLALASANLYPVTWIFFLLFSLFLFPLFVSCGLIVVAGRGKIIKPRPMGTKNSSSKRKSSKRKTSKTPSEARQRKKSRRTKSKKLYRRDDSVSSYSDDDSRSSMSISSSSSHDHRRRARSRMRSDAKGSRKRTRSSPSHDISEYSRHVKKRKGSRKSRYSEVRKKTGKKKRRRDASISPINSDTHSCSTCKGGSSNSSGEDEIVRPRGRSRESKKDKRDLSKPSGTKKKKNRSQSSSHSRSSDSSDYTIKEKLAAGNDLRRLRSVVIVTKQPQDDEEKNWDKSGHKEEVVYDHDDYPSCRSNDSDDGGSKRDLSHHVPGASEKRNLEYVKGEDALISNANTIELTESGKDSGGQYDGSSSRSDGVGANNSTKGNKREVSAVASSSNGDDLETILRQKALENLTKFRKGLHTHVRTLPDQKTRSDSDVKQPSSAKAEFVQIKSPKWVDLRVVGAPQVVAQSTRPMTGIEPSCPTMTDGKISGGKYSGTEPGTAKCSAVCPPYRATISGNPEEKDLSCADAVFNKSEPGRSALRQELSGTCSTIKQAPTSQAFPKLVTDSGVNKRAVEASQTVRKTNGTEVSNAPDGYSCLKPTLEEPSSKERQNEVKDSSEFEKKTMSVMRGGEMVQVSYKVYIPKKAPALARRQLRRTGSDV
ncbi:uncharacterized protein LOC132308570 [Cornus florida]|uniref:uncharacterized protein LOC132308570 n=1 Tax=Cornus florida TaxID=4283 RepID=UPI00289CD3A1|nr:uncharacterized protein LOC132308570 [Cornus florida]